MSVIKILILDESNSDVDEILAHLKHSELIFKAKAVNSKKALAAALTTFSPDIILVDVAAQINIFETLELSRNKILNIPILIVSRSPESDFLKFLTIEATGFATKNSLNDLSGVIQKLLLKTENRLQFESAVGYSLNQFSDLVSRISDGFVALDLNWDFSFVNEKACEIFNIKHADFIGKNILEIFSKVDGKPFYEKYKEAIDTQKKVVFTLFYKPLNEWFENRVYPSSEGITIYFSNVSEEIKVQKTLDDYRNNLEELVKVRTKELEIEKENAQIAEKLKTAFIATMSHELRTPLNSIIGFSAILLNGMAGKIKDEQAKQIRMINKNGNHLLSLINDILDLSKIEAGELVIKKAAFDFHELLKNVMDTFLPEVQNKGIMLVSDNINDIKIINIYSDERRVRQILLNLISNAIKFTDIGEVLIQYYVKNNMLICRVVDSGIGIEEEQFSKIFNPFVQIEKGISRKYNGTGLGLFISKKIVEALDGEITLESKMGKGSTFTLKLPIEG